MRVRLQFLSEIAHVKPEVVRAVLVIGAPHPFQEVSVAARLPGVFSQHLQELELGWCERYQRIASADLVAAEVDLQITNRKHSMSVVLEAPKNGV